MIIRSARRKVHHHPPQSLQSFVNQLQLPWLCPAFNGHSRHQQRSRQVATLVEHQYSNIPGFTAQKSYRSSPIRPIPSRRGFAYAASTERNAQDDYLPWDTATHTPQTSSLPSWLPGSTQSDLPKFDPSNPIIIPDSMRLAPRRFRFDSGVGGEIADIHQILQACLQVGQLDRASTTVRRLNSIYKLDSSELINAHNAYISAVVAKVIITKDQELLRHLHKWFEVDLRGIGIRPNATTFALMVQATLNDSNERKVGRTVRRYLALSKDTEIYDEARTAILTQLSDRDASKVTRYDESSFYPSPEPVEDNARESFVSDAIQATSETRSPSVRPQTQKGLGLVTLQKSLHPLSDISSQPTRGFVAHERPDPSSFARQKRLEESTMSSALERWRTEHEMATKAQQINPILRFRPLGSLMWTWHEALLPLIKEEIQKTVSLEKAINEERASYGPFLQQVEPEKLSAITIITSLREMTKIGIRSGVTTARLVCSVGKAIEEEALIDSVKSRSRLKTSKSEDPQARAKKMARLLRRERYARKSTLGLIDGNWFDNQTASASTDHIGWSTQIRARVGAVMVAFLLQAAKFEQVLAGADGTTKQYEQQPALTKTNRFMHGQKYGMIVMNRTLAERFTKDPVASAIAKHLPMLVHPLPWTDFREGGYLTHPSNVVRFGTSHDQTKEYIEVAAKNGDMAQVFAALDVLGKTPWKINRQVFEVMIQAWNSGEALANLPAADPDLKYPPEPAPTDDEEARRIHTLKVKQVDDARDGMHSNRCFQNFQLEVARAFLDEHFYFPHNMDFRGRAYPIPPYLNHMGADHCRGILMFGDGKKLGETGLTWLRVHVANVYGYDKASFAERRDFAINHIADIYDSATNPLGGQRWWLKAECPWQCLATCIELKNALDSPDPTQCISHLPVHQDGTCNGLQHYAALGGDAIGARQVNLEPGERPSDIYSAVAEMVQQDVAKDAAGGGKVAQVLDGKITRKIVKQTVMTNVYGVTFAGAKLQVLRNIEGLYPGIFDAEPRLAYSASAYVAKKIFAALSLMFNGAHEIQFWLGECASRITESLTREQVQWIEDNAAGREHPVPYSKRPTNERAILDEHLRLKTSVIWTTPLKMPVVQPYRKSESKRVVTNLQHINIMEPSVSDPVSKRKQLQAFPPNFIHSLDATHMFLSALKCNELGLSFAAVHDSFWTHASTVDTMNTVLRDAFVRMHSEDITSRLAAEFKARYSGGMYLAPVKRNSVLGKKIVKLRLSNQATSKKSKSQVKINELLLERRRLRLLSSEDSAERAVGQAMVTPARLIEETVDERDLMFLEDIVSAIDETEDESDCLTDDFQGEVSQDGTELHQVVDQFAALPLEDGTAAKNAKRAKQARRSQKVWAWLPLTFPPVPKKGSFDVTRLKDSKYFFS